MTLCQSPMQSCQVECKGRITLAMKDSLSNFVASSLVCRHYENRSVREASVISGNARIDTRIDARIDTSTRKYELFPLSWAYYYLRLLVTVDFFSKVISSFPLFSVKAGLQVRRRLISKVNSDQNKIWQQACILLSLVLMSFVARITFEFILALSTIVRPCS